MLTVPLRSFYFIWIEHPRWGMQEGSCPASSASELALRSTVITPASKTDCTTFDMAWCTVGLCRAAATMSGTSVLQSLGSVKKKVVLQ